MPGFRFAYAVRGLTHLACSAMAWPMYDLRPVGYVTGLLLTALGVAMLFPLATDLLLDTGNEWAFFETAAITAMVPSKFRVSARYLVAPRSMAVCPSCPHACMMPSFWDL